LWQCSHASVRCGSVPMHPFVVAVFPCIRSLWQCSHASVRCGADTPVRVWTAISRSQAFGAQPPKRSIRFRRITHQASYQVIASAIPPVPAKSVAPLGAWASYFFSRLFSRAVKVIELNALLAAGECISTNHTTTDRYKSLTIISGLVYPITLWKWKSCDCPPGIPSARSAWIDHYSLGQ